MEPTNDHERVIARAIDKKFLEDPGRLNLIISDVALSLDFVTSPSDVDFLVGYFYWRRDHQVSPAN
jgi:hypothetical protein